MVAASAVIRCRSWPSSGTAATSALSNPNSLLWKKSICRWMTRAPKIMNAEITNWVTTRLFLRTAAEERGSRTPLRVSTVWNRARARAG
jgi:hypothetical protein